MEDQRYKPGPDFEDDVKDTILDFSLTGSKELWLIQWPINQLKPSDINGKVIPLKLHSDGDFGSFVNSSGKKYDVVSFSSQTPDATVFLASNSESKVVGKISRRVCLIHYPELSELEKSASHFSSSHRSGGSQKSSMPPRTSSFSSKHPSSTLLNGTSHEVLTSTRTLQQSTESTKRSKHKRARESSTCLEQTTSAGESMGASRPDSHVTPNSVLSSENPRGLKSKKKKKKVQE